MQTRIQRDHPDRRKALLPTTSGEIKSGSTDPDLQAASDSSPLTGEIREVSDQRNINGHVRAIGRLQVVFARLGEVLGNGSFCHLQQLDFVAGSSRIHRHVYIMAI